MRNERSRTVWLGLVGLVRCSQPHSLFVTETVSDVAQPPCRHDTTNDARDVTLTGSGWDHLTQPHHPNQTGRERTAMLRTGRDNFRTVVSGRLRAIGRFLLGRFVCGGAQRISPPASGGENA